MTKRRVVLVGLSGTGKSSLGRVVSQRLGWQLADIDELVEAHIGRTIPEIFATDGEAAFRAIERTLLVQSLSKSDVVIATGGGAAARDDVWTPDLLGDRETLVIHLDADPEIIVERLRAQSITDGTKAQRPLLKGDLTDNLQRQRQHRQAYFNRADVTLDVSGRSIDEVAVDICELVCLASGIPSIVTLSSTSSPSRIEIGPGARHRLGSVIRDEWPNAHRIWLCVDGNLLALQDGAVTQELGCDGFDLRIIPVAPGEGSKSVEGISRLWDALLDGGAERSDVLVAVGGGVVGDLVGFAAATTLRGIGFVQVPTTLLSMVDSSVGGKTGINHPSGKNLIGAFYQPSRVIVDTELLDTLPDREFTSGWGEVIKHGIIEASTPGGEEGVLLSVLERNAAALRRKESPLLSWVVRRNISLKAAVVEADEREANVRAILNFGHTFGHGIEASGYRVFHGEAVGIGMTAVLNLSAALGMATVAQVERVMALVAAFGLPTSVAVDPATVRERMSQDKKKSGGKQLWVLLGSDGRVSIERDIDESHIATALSSVIEQLPSGRP